MEHIHAPFTQAEDMIFDSQGVHIATIGNSENMESGLTTEAEQVRLLNLFEAAPELLEALEICIQAHEAAYLDAEERGDGQASANLFDELQQARSAISKARGHK